MMKSSINNKITFRKTVKKLLIIVNLFLIPLKPITLNIKEITVNARKVYHAVKGDKLLIILLPMLLNPNNRKNIQHIRQMNNE